MSGKYCQLVSICHENRKYENNGEQANLGRTSGIFENMKISG